VLLTAMVPAAPVSIRWSIGASPWCCDAQARCAQRARLRLRDLLWMPP